jgi:hypothetical protein
MFRETIAIYCETHTKHINTLCGKNAEFSYVKAGGTYETTGLYRVNRSVHPPVLTDLQVYKYVVH